MAGRGRYQSAGGYEHRPTGGSAMARQLPPRGPLRLGVLALLVEQLFEYGQSAGYPHTRGFAQMEWPLIDSPGTEDLIEYETRLNYLIPKYEDAAICSYDLIGVKSMIAVAVYPKVDRPYLLGLHQCFYRRVWTPQEERLFHEIGRRLAHALDTLLMLRDLRKASASSRRAGPSSLPRGPGSSRPGTRCGLPRHPRPPGRTRSGPPGTATARAHLYQVRPRGSPARHAARRRCDPAASGCR